MARKQAAAPQEKRIVRQAGAVYDEDELSALLHVGRETIRGLRQTGQLRYLKAGKKILYPDQYLQEYIDRAGVLHGDQVTDRLALLHRR